MQVCSRQVDYTRCYHQKQSSLDPCRDRQSYLDIIPRRRGQFHHLDCPTGWVVLVDEWAVVKRKTMTDHHDGELHHPCVFSLVIWLALQDLVVCEPCLSEEVRRHFCYLEDLSAHAELEDLLPLPVALVGHWLEDHQVPMKWKEALDHQGHRKEENRQ